MLIAFASAFSLVGFLGLSSLMEMQGFRACTGPDMQIHLSTLVIRSLLSFRLQFIYQRIYSNFMISLFFYPTVILYFQTCSIHVTLHNITRVYLCEFVDLESGQGRKGGKCILLKPKRRRPSCFLLKRWLK